MFRNWILAARPKTLFVSVAPVVTGSTLAYFYDCFQWRPALICLIFALLAQITSNFINDYADFRKGADRDDRLGPERAVASGVISPKAMLTATFITIGVALLLGLSLIAYGGPWLILVGALVAVFAFAYSCGPYPLSYHGWGDVAVLVFYGIVPVTFTYYVQGLDFPIPVLFSSVAVGLVGVNLLIVNNYRDMEADRISGKKTTVVRFGRRAMSYVYLANCIIAYNIGYAVVNYRMMIWIWISAPFILFSFLLWHKLTVLKGKELNRVLGMSAFNVLVFALTLSAALIFYKQALNV